VVETAALSLKKSGREEKKEARASAGEGGEDIYKEKGGKI